MKWISILGLTGLIIQSSCVKDSLFQDCNSEGMVDPRYDPAHCGGCGIACGTNQACLEGKCVSVVSGDGCTDAGICPTGLSACDNRCADLKKDIDHCGNCNEPCANGQRCVGGVCVVSCLEGFVACNGICIDPNTNNAHCGAKGNCSIEGGPGNDNYRGARCAGREGCFQGRCYAPTSLSNTNRCFAERLDDPFGFVNCGGVCIDPLTNNDYCGAKASNTSNCSGIGDGNSMGNSCKADQYCDNGECRSR